MVPAKGLTTVSAYHSILTINTLRLSVRLGIDAPEREKPQPVEVDVRFYFDQSPECALDDTAQNFICYDQICSTILNYATQGEFRFLEYLTMQLHAVIRHDLKRQVGNGSENVKVWIRLLKCVPPVPYMIGGAEYVYSDLDAAAPRVEAR
jgi:FolB domain-containing protein